MPNHDENRVLQRKGARQLSREEISKVSGGECTIFMTIDPITGEFDQRVD